MITGTINLGPLLANLKKAAALTQRDTRDMIKQQATLFVFNAAKNNGIINITPPFNDRATTGNAAFAQGLDAIKSDMRVPFAPQSADVMARARRQTADGATADTVLLFARKDGTLYGVERSYFQPDPSPEDMRTQAKRYYRNGKMSRAGTYTRDIGRWKFINKWVVSQTDLDIYIANAGSKIGFAASCWYRAAVAAGLSPRGVPDWVRKHTAAPGAATISLSDTAFSVELGSDLKYNSGLNMARLAARALLYRQNAIEKQLPYLVAAALKKAQLT